MSSDFNEDTRVKLPALVHLTRLGYKYLSQKSSSFKENLIPETNIVRNIFDEAIHRLNPDKEDINADDLLEKLRLDLENDDLGEEFYKNLMKGRDDIKLIDLENFDNNTLNCVTELTFKNGEDEFRPDITILVNGMPLAFIEVKKPNNNMGIKAERDRMNMRFKNPKFKRFINEFQLLIFSNNMEYDGADRNKLIGAFYATTSKNTSAKFNFFREQKKSEYIDEIKDINAGVEDFILKDNNHETIKTSPEYQANINPDSPTNRILSSLLSKPRFRFFLKYGLAYVREINQTTGETEIQKHIMRYPQYFATRAIQARLGEGVKRGIIWHTQGSGKTALAYFSTRILADYYREKGAVPKFYFIVDRIDLAIQAQQEFEKRGLKVRTVSSRDDLVKEFASSSVTKSGKLEICVVNIQKFSDDTRVLNDSGYDLNTQRVFFLDEAHRSYNPKGSFLASLYNADKDSVKIALTGTPIIAYDRDPDNPDFNLNNRATTRQIFGDYIHKYYYNESIRDGFTLRLVREEIEAKYREILNKAYTDISIQVGDLDKRLIYAHPNFVEPMLDYIVKDLERTRIANGDNSIGGMIVTNTAINKGDDLSLNQAKVLYDIFQQKYGDKYTCAIITDQGGDKESRQDLVNDFKAGKIDFLIVFNMLLTGFDCPRLKKLYLGRVIKAHNLLQTLTRVNRPYEDFRVGYIVDFADISREFDITNQAYLKELKEEYKGSVDDDDEDNIFGSLFVSKEEIEKKINGIKNTLFAYDTENRENFASQITAISDKEVLINLRRTLSDAKEVVNLVRLFGYDDIANKLDPKFIATAFNIVSDKINLMNATDALNNHANARQLLNLAIEDVVFDFQKVGEEELRLAADEGEDLTRKIRYGLVDNFDHDDPAWTTLYDEFRRLLEKEQIEHASMTVEQQNEINAALKRIYDTMVELNRKNNLIRDKYHGDAKAARVHKRIVGNPDLGFSNVSVYDTISYVKDLIDEQVRKNSAIIENNVYFSEQVLKALADAFTSGKAGISTFSALKRAGEMLTDEYYKEYTGKED